LRNNPRVLGSVLRLVRFLKVLFEKVVLCLNLSGAILSKVVQLSAKRYKVHWSDVVRPKNIIDFLLPLRVHRETVVVVGEVAEMKQNAFLNKESFAIE